MSIFTLTFWRAALERGVKATAYSASSLLIANGTGLLDTNWQATLSVAGMAGLLSLLGSVASDAVTSGSGPSLTNAEVLPRSVNVDAPAGAVVTATVESPLPPPDAA